MQGHAGWQSGTLFAKQQGTNGQKAELQPSIEDLAQWQNTLDHGKDPRGM